MVKIDRAFLDAAKEDNTRILFPPSLDHVNIFMQAGAAACVHWVGGVQPGVDLQGGVGPQIPLKGIAVVPNELDCAARFVLIET